MELKRQDLLVVFMAAAHPERRWTYASLGQALRLSTSEAHASVKRAVAAGLAASRGRGNWSPLHPALLEFAVHGVRYIWPATLGPVKRGVLTGFGAEPMAGLVSAASGEAPVWAYASGKAKGPSIAPLYPTVPQTSLADTAFYRLLALQDGLRVGRARERAIAADLLKKELSNLRAR